MNSQANDDTKIRINIHNFDRDTEMVQFVAFNRKSVHFNWYDMKIGNFHDVYILCTLSSNHKWNNCMQRATK